MKEQLVSFETAKLAKEKGFELETSHYYFEDGEFREHRLTGTNGYYGEEYCFDLEEFFENWNSKWLTKKNGDRCFGCNKSMGYFETYSSPTQSILQKWLREVHNIFVSVSGHSKIWQFYIISYHQELGVPVNLANFDLEFKKKYLDTFIAYESYESALEVGLYEALQLIK